MQLFFLSAAIILGYEIVYLLGWDNYFGDLKYVLLNATTLGLILFIFTSDFVKKKFAPFIMRHTDSLIRLSVVALLQAIVAFVILLIQ